MTPETEWAKENIRNTVNYLRHNPDIESQDLFGANKLMNPDLPRFNGTKVTLENSLEKSSSSRSPIVQDLEALFALGGGTLVGVVSAKDEIGNTYRYLSLYSGNPNKQRAQFIATVNAGQEITIGRATFSGMGDDEEFKAVSGEHAVVSVDHDGVLTVIDRDSTNGTTVFTASTESAKNMPFDSRDVRAWAIDTGSVHRQLEQIEFEKDVLRGSLGKFTLDDR